MCRSARYILTLACCLSLLTAHAVAQHSIEQESSNLTRHGEAAEQVSTWLEQHSLHNLLALHLEQQIARTTGQQQRALIQQLADIYAHLLESAQDPDRRQHLEDRARHLLAMTDAEGLEELRLSLLTTAYRAAERIAEQHRLRLATEDDLARARSTLADIVPQLRQLNEQIISNILQLDRLLRRASGAQAAALTANLDQMEMLYQHSAFLTAWAHYYDAVLNNDIDAARLAEQAFAPLLLTDSPRPQPDEISLDLRAAEPFARAILGMALTKSRTASSTTALNWLDLLTAPNTFAPVREQVPIWEIVIHLEHGEYQQVKQTLHAPEPPQQHWPATWLRLVAIHALEEAQTNANARELALSAVTELAALGELDQIFDLAQRYGTDALGSSGFALQYVNGVLAYRMARNAQQSDDPDTRKSHLELYQQAQNHLSAALRQHDAEQYPTAIGPCKRLKAWTLYMQGQYLDARDWFLHAEADLTSDEAAEALWMAIVCLDQVIKFGGTDALRAQKEELVNRFLAAYPDSDRAPTLTVVRASAADRIDDQILQQLLNIPPDHPSYESAARRAAHELYQRYRAADTHDRANYARVFLNVAATLLDLPVNDQSSANRLLLDIRRTLEVALGPAASEPSLAREALDRYERLIADGLLDDQQHAQEITLRKVQERLLHNDVLAASQLADQLWDADARSPWSRLAVRAIFQHAHAMEPADNPMRLRLLVRHGGRVLREFEDDPRALQQQQVLAYHAVVAEALNDLWQIDGQTQHARAALFLYQRMLSAQPRNATFLEAAAVLATKLDELEFAADCWRRISMGSPAESDQWYQARYELIAVLASLDPQQAIRVMQQHVQLFPNYGPEPWGARLRQLHGQLQSSGGQAGGAP